MKRSRFLHWFFLLAAALAIACGNINFAWNEEVVLSSGETIVVKRKADGKPFGEIGGPGGWDPQALSIEVVRPKRPDNPAPWVSPYLPILFDRDAASGEWFLVVSFITCERWRELGKPKLPYAQWNYRGGQWQRTELDPKLIGRAANLLTDIRSSGEPDHTVQSKEMIMSDRRIAIEYRKIYEGWKPVGCTTDQSGNNVGK